jgi:hypothetical protein
MPIVGYPSFLEDSLRIRGHDKSMPHNSFRPNGMRITKFNTISNFSPALEIAAGREIA